MTYDELDSEINKAWEYFFEFLGSIGVDEEKCSELMDAKDCFNSVYDCIVQSVELEDE